MEENNQPYSKEDGEYIDQYIQYLKTLYNNQLCCALVHFLSKYSSSSSSIINKRKLFLLKVLKECTVSSRFDINLFPMEVEKKLIVAYTEEQKKEEVEKQAHIAELMEEMNEIF